MPSQSKAQQKFMGMVHALQKGDIEPSSVSKDVRDTAKSMKKSDAKDFASTKHKGLPKKVKQEILSKLKEYANKMGRDHLGGDDYISKRKGGLRDFDGYDNVDYNKDMPMDEATKGDIMRAVKGKPNPYTLVVIKRDKVIYQKDIKNPQDAPAIYSVIRKHMDKGERIHIEDRTGKIVFKEGINEGFKSEYKGNDGIIWKKGKTRGGVTNFTPYYKGHDIDKGGHNFKTEKELKDFIKDYILSNQLYNKYRFESVNEGMFSTIDQIRQDSKDVRDFIKKVFADRDFKDMKNDKEFLKYLKSIYEGVDESKGVPQNYMQGRTSDYHTALRGKNKDYSGGTNFKKTNHGQPDLENDEEDQETNQLSVQQTKLKEEMGKLSSSERIELYKLYSKAMKAMPGSPNQNKIKVLINKLRKKADLKPLPISEYGQRLDLSFIEDEESRLKGTPEPKDAIDRDLDENVKQMTAQILRMKKGEMKVYELPSKTQKFYYKNKKKFDKLKEYSGGSYEYTKGDQYGQNSVNEIGVFPIQNYIKGIIPSNFIDSTTRDKKEKLKSTLRDLKSTLNHFWKQHDIPYRIK